MTHHDPLPAKMGRPSGRSGRCWRLALGSAVLLACASGVTAADGSKRVTVRETPNGGIQPQAIVDGAGTIHLIYFKGEPGAGDLFHVRMESGGPEFSSPVRVNSRPNTAIATGTIRGGQLAIGQGGRLHVVWNGATAVPPAGSPLYYTRSDEKGISFEPQRNLMGKTSALDGGATVAADRAGNVFVAWHARSADSAEGEMGRRLWIARSADEGKTFSTEKPAWDRQTGACACCGTRALADSRGVLYLLYRAATRGTERDMYLLTSQDQGEHFRGRSLQPWRINSCPMSSESLVETGSGVLAAWETQGQVGFARIDPQGKAFSEPVAAPGRGIERKHPAVAGNAQGDVILVWDEGTGWQKGGSLAWQVFTKNNRPSGEKGTLRGGIPVWGLAAVVARPDGGFLIVH